MKVTVCFGNVRVVVPCGGGEILVRDLIREATLRYRKATGKNSDSWVAVHNLQSQGGGILDPDDRLSDVVDDREQILASFEDGGDGIHQHAGGDGASGSSVGTGSPDIFHDGEHKYGPNYPRTDIEVTGEQIASGVPGVLQVRRGSEPALNQLPAGGPPAPSEHTKRWSAAPLILEPPTSVQSNPYQNCMEWNPNETRIDENDGDHFKRIARDGSNRLSMQFLGDGAGYRWAEAAERVASSRLHASTSLPREGKRKEPLGQANSTSPPPPLPADQNATINAELIIIRNEPGPLGIHVVPNYDRLGKDRGLLVQGIEPGGRIDRDGRLAMYDRIIEINGQNLLNMPFQRVQEMFKLSLTSPELRLKVIKNNSLEGLRKPPPPPIYPRFPDDKENVSMVECEQKHSTRFTDLTNTKVATVSPTKKVPAVSKNLKSLLQANTRKIGRKIEIELVKGPHGLGFSITTRDNPAGGNCPIYIKNIIPKGAAVEDGRLKIGDRLLEVNGVEMTGKTQAEAVAVLRNAPPGSKVNIVVSRQEDVMDSGLQRMNDNNEREINQMDNCQMNNEDDTPPNIPPLPQSHLQALQQRNDKNATVSQIISQFQDSNIANNNLDDSVVFPWKHREILTFNIPVHDSEKAGLGISVKGKTSGTQDLGIFIKSVINGGAASRDKRLRTNDQLLNVNGISLLQQSNSDAMETLRKAMLHTEGPVPGNITLTIARRASSPSTINRSYANNNGSETNLLNATTETDPSHSSNSGASGSSTNTVIFNPQNMNQSQTMHTWNPVLDRLTGNNKQLRNESYYKATHDTWIAAANNSYGNITNTTLNTTTEPILIEDEYGSRVLNQQKSNRINVHMTNNMMNIANVPENRNEHEPDGKVMHATIDSNPGANESGTPVQNSDATYASQLSLENPQGFSRDAFGRQSMSEKRHATLDAKNTDTYQRTKKMREERIRNKEVNLVRVGSVESVISVNRSSEHPEYADKLGQLGPSLGMKKSSSLESLQTMVQEIQMQEECDPAYSYRGALKVIRGRGCEESFRAAVDKHIVDPNHQTEISAKKHWLLDGPGENEREIDGFNNVRGAPRQSSLNAALDSKHKITKKKPGLLKGIGSMFRFGKHRKMDFPNMDIPENESIANQSQKTNDENQSDQQQQSNERLQEIQKEPIYQRHAFVHRHAEQVQVIPENAIAPTPPIKYRNHDQQQQAIRRNKIHMQDRIRYSYYQHQQPDDRENLYEQRMPPTTQSSNYGGRPGSRSGITESVPFTHYVNYNELQNHLKSKDPLSDSQIVQMRLQVQQQRLKVEEESRKQHQYHSQRQTRTDNQLRPASNFYEYESVQSMLNTRTNRQMQQQQQQQQQDMNSNSLSRQQQQQQMMIQGRTNSNNNNNNRGIPHRGPFVTHVTIGEQQHQKNGTKV